MLYKVNPWNEDSHSSKLKQFIWLPVVVQLSETISSNKTTREYKDNILFLVIATTVNDLKYNRRMSFVKSKLCLSMKKKIQLFFGH